MHSLLSAVVVGSLLALSTASGLAEQAQRVVSVQDVQWQMLNPARGDSSPRAGVLWGDLTGEVATGFLARFVDGFSSPPHIHNTGYRAVVIHGEIHNDDPTAAPMWMGPGSFWTQPEGEVHITAAQGPYNLALVEIDMGPYLVLPVDEAFDSGARPVNVHSSNLVWQDWQVESGSLKAVEQAHLWRGRRASRATGRLIRLARGFEGDLISRATPFHAVLVAGQIDYHDKQPKRLLPGSYFGSEGNAVHTIAATGADDAVIYVHAAGDMDIVTKP